VHEGGSRSKRYEDNVDVYNGFSFQDGTEIIKTFQPHLVIISNDYEYLQRSIMIASIAHGIPTVDLLASAFGLMELDEGYDKRKVLGNLQLLRDHPISIIKRYLFLYKTLFRAKYGIGKMARTLIKDIYLPFVSRTPRFSFGGGDLNIVSTPEWGELLTKKGIVKDKVAITGDVSLDVIHRKVANLTIEPTRNNGKTIEILLVTSSMVEHGIWTEAMRKEIITGIATGLRELEDARLRVKIHPTSEDIDIYKQLLNPIDSDIEIIQSGDLLSLINTSDFIITFGHSSAILEALLLKKPVYLMNIFKEDRTKNFFLKDNVVMECISIEELISNIKMKTYSFNNSQRIDDFISKHAYLYDGKCSERAASHIIPILQRGQDRMIST
jgi:hypothetical protein